MSFVELFHERIFFVYLAPSSIIEFCNYLDISGVSDPEIYVTYPDASLSIHVLNTSTMTHAS